jgi:hypothetical protein
MDKEVSTMATSRRMRKTGQTVKSYADFLSKQKQVLINMGYSEEKANEQAEMICSMYKHTFAEWKEV